MNPSRIAAVCSSFLLLASLVACSSDESSSNSGTATGPLASLAGTYGVALIPQFSNCAGAVYFPQEAWVSVPVGQVLNLVPVPAPGTSPVPVETMGGADASAPPQDAAASEDASPSQSPSPQPKPQDTAAAQATPPPFSATVDSTLHFQASQLTTSTTQSGCLQRTTTLLAVQFTADGKQLGGTRSVYNEYAGGTDCPADCRIVFGLAGQKLAQ